MLRTVIARRAAGATALLLVTIAPATAQTLRARIDDAPAGAVLLSFAARPGVCADGQTYSRSFDSNVTTFASSGELCVDGPVYVVLDRDARNVIAVRTYIGQAPATAAATDLGRVAAAQAAEYLIMLAGQSEGRVGRDAIMPAALADSAHITAALTSLARDRALARETRTAAISQLARTAAGGRTVVDALVAIAQQEADNLTVRRQALSALSRVENGAGMPALINLTAQARDPWTAREAMSVIASSGDPRARAHLRATVQQDDGTSDDLRLRAIRGLGQRYATAQDATLLRAAYARLSAAPARDAILTAIADIGGGDNVRWLLERVGDEQEPAARRRRALESAARAGARTADLVRLYDHVSEHQLKDALVMTYGRSGERMAVDKLIEIAKHETNVNVRRKAISVLGASDDPRVKAVLAELVGVR